MLKNMKSFTAELVGTFFTVFIGCSVACLTIDSSVFIFATAAAFAISYFMMHYFLSKFTDCHLNPAISLAMFINKKLSLPEMGLYMAAQFTGAILGGLFVALVSLDFGNIGQNVLYAGKSGGILAGGFFVEIILTFIFVYMFIAIKNKEKDTKQGVMLSLILLLIYMPSVALCGGSLNPAKGFAMAILSAGRDLTSLTQIWIYLVAPFIGAVGAAFGYAFLAKHGLKVFDIVNIIKNKIPKKVKAVDNADTTTFVTDDDTVSFDNDGNSQTESYEKSIPAYSLDEESNAVAATEDTDDSTKLVLDTDGSEKDMENSDNSEDK